MTAGPEPERPGGPTAPAPPSPDAVGKQGAAVQGEAAHATSCPAASQPIAVNAGTAREAAAPTDAAAEDLPRTGLDPVDRVLAREAALARLPVTERAAAYEELHAELERILSEDPGKLPGGLLAASSPVARATPGVDRSVTAADSALGRSQASRPGEETRPGQAARPGGVTGAEDAPAPRSGGGSGAGETPRSGNARGSEQALRTWLNAPDTGDGTAR